MCCGAECGQCTGNLAYLMEKLVSFVALTAVVSCIVVLMMVTMGIGIGLGYNYCFVELKIISTEKPALRSGGEEEPSALDEGPPQTDDPTYRRSMATASPEARRTYPLPAIKHTMAIPLNADLDFLSLLTMLRGRNRNVTLELIT